MGYQYEYPRPAVAVDLIIFRGSLNAGEILLIKRKHEPFANSWALPGGFLDEGETLDEAAMRELHEETNLRVAQGDLQQLKAYSEVDRDPRTRVISVVFVGRLSDQQSSLAETKAGDDAADAQWFSVLKLPGMAFDHQQIIEDGLEFLAGLSAKNR